MKEFAVVVAVVVIVVVVVVIVRNCGVGEESGRGSTPRRWIVEDSAGRC